MLANMQKLESEFDEIDAEFDMQFSELLDPADLTDLNTFVNRPALTKGDIIEEDEDDDYE